MTTEGRDTVTPLLNTVFALWKRGLDTVIGLQRMPLSPSDPCHEPSMHEIESSEPWEGLSNATVDLSVSCLSSACTQGAFPSSRVQLLTIEWE